MFLQKVLVDKIILYESILISKSPTYEVIDSFQLKRLTVKQLIVLNSGHKLKIIIIGNKSNNN